MSGANLTPLLVRVRGAGLSVQVDRGDLVVCPKDRLTPELRAELLRHKPDLLELLTWRESEAHALLKDATAYLAEFYFQAKTPDCHLEGLDSYEVAIDAAFYERDMFGLRVAVREWVRAGVAMFKASSNQDRDRGAA